jgi:hypothetical protein
MLTLHYNGYDIPTGKDFSVRLSWKNPACFTSEIPGAAGLGIDIPVNDYSRAIFGNPERFEKYRTGSGTKYQNFEIRFSGALLMSGALNITSADQEKYSGWLQAEIGIIGEAQRDKFISDLEWDPDGDRTFENKTAYDDSADDYQPYPLINGAFWNGKGRESAVKIEYTDDDGEIHKVNDMITFLTEKFRVNFGRIVNKPADDLSIDTEGENEDSEACVISPFLFLRPFLKMLFKLNNHVIDRNDMVPTPPLLDLCLEKYLLLYNNFNIMKQTFLTEKRDVTRFDRETNTEITTEESIIYDATWEVGVFLYSSLIPHVSLNDILIGLQNFLNFIFVFRPLSKVDIIDRNSILDSDPFDLDRYFLGSWNIGNQVNVTLKFINEFDKEDRMFGQEYHDFTDRRAEFGDPVDTHDDLDAISSPVEGELRLVKDENKIYEYKWKVLTSEDFLFREDQLDSMGWEFVSSGPQPFLHGDSDEIEEIKSCFSTLQIIKGDIDLPVVLQQGNLRKMKGSFIDFSPRLINSQEVLYPEALNWDGDGGLFKLRWEKWANFWKNRLPVDGSFDLPLNVLYYVVNNITGKFKTQHGDFIIETIDTEFGSNLIGTTRITGYKI